MTTTDSPTCRRKSAMRDEEMRSRQGKSSSPNKEWDLCVKEGSLTVGAGMAAGMFVGILMGMGVPLVWGTGAGILWSVKRCRALMRDGIMTPEQARAKKEERIKERLEKKRELEEGKKGKTKSAPSHKHKGGRSPEDPDSHPGPCCRNLEELLKKQKRKECEILKKIEKEMGTCSKMDKIVKEQLRKCKEEEAREGSGLDKSKLNFASTTSVKLFVPQSRAFRTKVANNGREMCLCTPGTDMKSCPDCALPVRKSSLLSSKNEVDQPIQLTLEDNIKKFMDNNDEESIPSEPQKEPDADQNDNGVGNNPVTQPEDPEGIPTNPSDLLVLKEVSSMNEGQNEEEDEEYGNEPNFNLFLDDLTRHEPSLSDEDSEEEVIEINGSRFEVIIQEVNDDTDEGNEDKDDISAEPEVTFPEVVADFTQKLSNLDDASIEEELGKEEVIFVETYKSESWPFSFSLPSLDKFHKKSADSAFKWPPLPSSIIVRPRKEPPCTCADGNTQGEQHQHEVENPQPEPLNFEACTCGQPEGKDTCKAQGHT